MFEMIGDDAAIRISASRSLAGRPSARAGVVIAQTSSGETPSMNTTSASHERRPAAESRHRRPVEPDQRERQRNHERRRKQRLRQRGERRHEESDEHARGHEFRGMAADER